MIQAFSGLMATLLITAASPAVFAADKAGSVPLNTRVERLERRISRLTEMMMQLDALKRENSELRGQVELQNHTIEALKRRQRDLYIDIDQRLSQLQNNSQPAAAPVTPTAKVLPPPAPPTAETGPVVHKEVKQASTVTSSEETEYQAAFKLLSPSEKRYPEAIKALTAFLKKYPQSRLADNAQYWLAEANYVSQNNEVALQEFQKVIEQFPNSPKVSGALLKIGYLQDAAGKKDLAKKALNEVVSKYPGSSAASMAKKRLQQIQ